MLPDTGHAYENRTDYKYDNLGRLKKVTQVDRSGVSLGTPEATSYTYNLLDGLDRTINANGLIQENVYDSLNRLDKLVHWRDANNNGNRDTNEIRAEFDYTVRTDGKRTSSTEKILDETGTLISQNQFDWSYDAVDRLVSETLTNSSSTGYKLDWVYDLSGNRSKQTKLAGETTTYSYDANDRLIDSASTGIAQPESTHYSYAKTQQSGKTTTAGSVTTTQTFGYDLHGLLSTVVTQKNDGSNLTKTVYGYDSSGTRIRSSQFVATSEQPSAFSLQSTTEYLTDSANLTGYSQVLQETEFNASGQATKKVVYAIGHDQISQTTLTPTTGNSWAGAVAYFGTDGHGSVRVLYDLAGVIVRDQSPQTRQQLYTFDAYGNLLGWNGAQPLTNYLYSGESFDFNIGQQYLRARFYDATTGRFNRLDPYFGNTSDPQSFHKYAYVHGDPIQGVDPTGKFFTELWVRVKSDAANLAAYMSIQAQLLYYQAVSTITVTVSILTTQFQRFWAFGQAMINRLLQMPTAAWQRITEWITRPSIPTQAQAAANGFSTHNEIVDHWALGGRLGGQPFQIHHLVEQFTRNIARFGERAIHSVSNTVPLKPEVHQQISALYSSGPEKIRWLAGNFNRVRDYVSTGTWEQQYRFGSEVLSHLTKYGSLETFDPRRIMW